MCCVKSISFLILNVSTFLAKEITNTIDKELMESKESDANNTDSNVEGKIVGGEFARDGEFPHVAFLAAYCDPKDEEQIWSCGSSVLTQEILLTAGHCVEICQTGFQMEIYAGALNYLNSKHVRDVARYLLHGKYNSSTIEHDIALVLLVRSLPLSSRVKRAIVHPLFPDNMRGQLAGWGWTDEDGTLTDRLKVVSQTVRSSEFCARHLELSHAGNIFCASSGNKGKYPYKGDSGSGLIINNHQVIGLVSFRIDTYRDIIFYANVSYYYSWIVSKSRKLYCFQALK